MSDLRAGGVGAEDVQPDRLDLSSTDITNERRRDLLRLFPEARTEDGQIDFERLKLALGEAVDVGKERYGMSWPGKAECFRTIQAPSLGTLLPSSDESVAFDTTENVIIEGDNLEVLKLLQKSYLGRMKVIYIDPPYNTGTDFIYPDNYAQSLQTYLECTGQTDAEGRQFGTNADTEGRFHSRWLSMMFPRLYIARNLLRDDGAVLISIDDNEIDNLRKLCDDIFGQENFVGTFCWRRRTSSALADQLVSTDHEYVVCYQRHYFESLGMPKTYEAYTNPDNDPLGPWKLADLTVGMTKEQRPNQFYDLVDPATGRVFPANPNRVWCYVPESMARAIAEGRVAFPKDGDKRPHLKRYKSDLKSAVDPISTWLSNVGLNTQATREFQSLIDANIQIYPKPCSLLRTLLAASAGSDDIILDFFAGSGTTAQAVLELNKEDGGNRKFILVQLPEPTGREDYSTIADITKERVRRVIAKLNAEDAGKLDLDDSATQDRGFRVFKLAESNFKPWNAEVAHEEQALEEQLDLHVEHIREGRSDQDLLYEILLKSGFPLTTQVDAVPMAGKTVYAVAGGVLFICLERELTLDVIRTMADSRPERVVCLDAGFAGNDQLKANAVQIFKTKGVTSFKTV